MYRRSFHAVFGPQIHSSITNVLLRHYVSAAAGSTTPPSKPTTSKKLRSRRRSNSTDKKKVDVSPSDKSRKNRAPSKKPSISAEVLPKGKKAPRPESPFRSHSVWKEASVWVPRSPRRPEQQSEEPISPSHPLLLKDKQLSGEWEPTPPKGHDTAHLKQLLLRNTPSANQALQVMAESEEDSITSVSGDEDLVEMSFSPGTFVETRKNETCAIAVLLGEMIEDQKWKVLSLALSGEVFTHLRQDVQFAIPGFVSADLAARCGSERITDDPKCLNARVEVLRKLKQLNMDVESAYKTEDWTRHRYVNVYNETRSIDPTRWSKTTVKHVTDLLWQQPKYHHYYAVHRYLMEHPLYFVATDNCLTSQTFYVRPLRDVEEIKTVENSIADHRRNEDGQLYRFLSKAQRVIESYWMEQNNNHAGPMSQKPAKHTWNEEDQCFLRFLLRSLSPWRSVQKDPYEIAKVNLMKFLYPKIFNVSDVAVFQSLKELGVLPPWHDPSELNRHANPTGDFYTADPYNKGCEEIAKRTVLNKAVTGAVLGPEDLRPDDPLDSVRHDFGDMRVYVIDEASAEELDDGISVERIPSQPDKYWVHAHIADPASLLHPGHILSLRARERGSTLYFRQKTFPLFPPSLIHNHIHGLSLGNRSSAGLGDRTLTFSTKLDRDGNILEYKIRAGIIRKVRKVTYAACDKLLGFEPLVKSYPFGRRFEEKPEPPATFTEDDVQDLKLLSVLAQKQVQRRFANNIFNLDLERASVDVFPNGSRIQSPSMSGSIFSGFPEMEYSVINSANLDQGSRMIVSEMMKLASRIASRVALEHDVPLIRRALGPIVPESEAATKAMLRARSENGYVPMHRFLNHMALTPSSVYTLEPKRHCGIGISDGEGYSRATSPLRRFEDLVVHFQLHHILLGSKAPPKYPFSLTEMESLCLDIATVDKTSRKLHQMDDIFHNLLFMKRWMEDRERGIPPPGRDPLAGRLTAYKMAGVKKSLLTNTYQCKVAIPELGIQPQLVDLDADFYDVPLSTTVQVKVKNIDLATNRLGMQVVLAK